MLLHQTFFPRRLPIADIFLTKKKRRRRQTQVEESARNEKLHRSGKLVSVVNGGSNSLLVPVVSGNFSATQVFVVGGDPSQVGRTDPPLPRPSFVDPITGNRESDGEIPQRTNQRTPFDVSQSNTDNRPATVFNVGQPRKPASTAEPTETVVTTTVSPFPGYDEVIISEMPEIEGGSSDPWDDYSGVSYDYGYDYDYGSEYGDEEERDFTQESNKDEENFARDLPR